MEPRRKERRRWPSIAAEIRNNCPPEIVRLDEERRRPICVPNYKRPIDLSVYLPVKCLTVSSPSAGVSQRGTLNITNDHRGPRKGPSSKGLKRRRVRILSETNGNRLRYGPAVAPVEPVDTILHTATTSAARLFSFANRKMPL